MKIGILGTGDSLVEAPFDDPSWELWTCSLGADDIYNRWDVHFQLHDLHQLGVGQMRLKPEVFVGHAEWLKSVKPPKRIVMQKHYDAIPASEAYPLGEVQEFFGVDGKLERYFRCMPAYMLAWAIMQKPAEIGCWGIDVSGLREYADQRPNVAYFIGWARGAGIPVHISESSTLCKARYLYGYDAHAESQFMLSLQRLWERREREAALADEIDTRAREAWQGVHRLEGMRAALNGGVGIPADQIDGVVAAKTREARDLDAKATVQRLMVSRVEGGIDIMHQIKEDRT